MNNGILQDVSYSRYDIDGEIEKEVWIRYNFINKYN